ncbi:MAG: stage III sporulation protein AD [Clostridiales bacterium]|nr:stage III sporulation protein AD [Clostridiales bacterium]
MEVLQLVGIGLIAAVIAVVLRQQKSELGIYISIATGFVIFMMIMGRLVSVVGILNNLARQANMDSMHLSVVLKVIGIAYITEYGSQICKDAGESAIASKIELGGKLIILSLTVPILAALLEIILQILP